ncbi:response regulator transcription factor [Pedobacter mucosus]|uniref:response regulator transcription factor n=1 Tax=Pedobacter mucosus TaxID=2895286 RepID=UPI001EE3ABF9|nr:response regulator [Pedobacter mucosus]UKT64457.1 response regulator [Pedobacter mucosus]
MERILVVDDDTATLEVIILLLEIEGYEVLGVANCSNIINVIDNFKPKAIIMDVIMGSVDGRDLCAELKNSYTHIPIMLMSVVNNFHIDVKHPMLADDYIDKPFELTDMVSKIAALVKQCK